ncbi:FAD-dependent oxidoreductase [Ornithinimicrobium panacihumi]|uniref:FAD-dependent oxidoreductase n=1 Tax=Ornithinimicrobium panacihumi TaxID=2008449 RepID=UPI003F88C6E6
MRVIVVGGGIAGLALAQGLVGAGVEVVVLERDADLSRTGGYKLHLGPVACAAAREVLPPDVWRELRSSAVRTSGFEITVRDHRGRLLAHGGEDEGESLDVDRVTLRLVLAQGLGDRVRTGVVANGYGETGQGVRVTLSTGEVVEGDVLVIADGSRSRLVTHLAGGRTNQETGLVGIAGRTDVDVLDLPARDLLKGRPLLAVGPAGVGLFASWHDPPATSRALTTGPVVIWGLIATAAQLPADLHTLAGSDLSDLAHGLLTRRRWAPALAGLPSASAPDTVAGFQFLAADPGSIAPWTPRRVTAIGDAAHAMPPTGGRGAATAIQDAAQLTARLTDAARGRTTVSFALRDSAQVMRGYAADAVRESLQPVRWIKAGAYPPIAAASRVLLPVLTGVAGVRRRWQGGS